MYVCFSICCVVFILFIYIYLSLKYLSVSYLCIYLSVYVCTVPICLSVYVCLSAYSSIYDTSTSKYYNEKKYRLTSSDQPGPELVGSPLRQASVCHAVSLRSIPSVNVTKYF